MLNCALCKYIPYKLLCHPGAYDQACGLNQSSGRREALGGIEFLLMKLRLSLPNRTWTTLSSKVLTEQNSTRWQISRGFQIYQLWSKAVRKGNFVHPPQQQQNQDAKYHLEELWSWVKYLNHDVARHNTIYIENLLGNTVIECAYTRGLHHHLSCICPM